MRHAHLIGKTLPCPKCQNPIQVQAPNPLYEPPRASPGSQPNSTNKPRGPAVNSEAITKVDPADWDMDQIENQPLPDFVPWSAESQQPDQGWQLPDPQSQAAISNTSDDPQSRVPANWQSEQSVARRNLLLLIAIGGGGFLLAVLAFVAFIRYYGKPNERGLANGDATPIVQPFDAAGPEDAVGKDAAPSAVDLANPNANPNTNPEDHQPPTQGPQEALGAQDQRIPSVPTDAAANATAAIGNGSKPEVQPPTASPPTFPPNIAQADDASSPAPPAPELGDPSTEEPTLEVDPNIDDKLPPIFQDFQRMFDAPSRAQWDDVGKADRIIENEISMENGEVVFREEYYPEAPPVPDWDQRSQIVLTAIESRPMSLLRCIHWFSKASNAGLTVDWFDINAAGIDLDEMVSIQAENQTLGEILAGILQPRDLEVLVDGDGFPHIRPTNERLVQQVETNKAFDANAIAGKIPQTDRDAIVPVLLQWLELGSCEYANGQLKWRDPAPHHEKARLCASLISVQQALDPNSAVTFDPNRTLDFGQPKAWWELRERLQTRLPLDTIVFEDRPIVDLLNIAASASQSRLVIDWPAAWSHGFYPNLMSVSILRGRTLEEISNRYLEDHALELVPLDSETVLLTSDAVRRTIERVIAVRLDQGMNVDDVQASLRGLVPRGPDFRSRFRLLIPPQNEKIALIRICLPTLAGFRDGELKKGLGVVGE